MTSGSQDRYEPLPGLLEIPGFLVRKIPPNARRPAAFAGAVLLAAVAVILALGIPAITESKDERAATEARAEREQEALRVAQLQAELRLREGRGPAARGLTGAQAIEARQALAAQLAADVKADAVSRVQAGEFTQSVARVECERFPRRVGQHGPRARPTSADRPLRVPGHHGRRARERDPESQQHRISVPRARALRLRPLRVLQDQRPARRGRPHARVPRARADRLRRQPDTSTAVVP